MTNITSSRSGPGQPQVTKTVRLGDLDHDPVIMAMPGQEARLKQLDDLKASIPEHGLLQGLKVRIDKGGTRYLVTAGNRRLATLRALCDAGAAIGGSVVTDEWPVPVILSEETDDSAREQAVAENVQRVALTPAAEARQYAELAAHAAPKEIAARFGVTEKRVRQRLKLAGLHPDVLDALDREEITVASAEAFTVEANPDKQLKYFRKAEGNSWKLGAAEIKKALTKKLVSGTAPITKLVGREAYEAAGGEIVEDPFDGTAYWVDGKLLDDLAAAHWAEQVKGWEGEGWAFIVEAKAYGQYFYPHNKLVTPTEVPLEASVAEGQAGMLARLKAILNGYTIDLYDLEHELDDAIDIDGLIDEGEDDDAELPEPTAEIREELGNLVAGINAIAASARTFTTEQKAGSGVVYWLDGSGPPVLGFIDEKRATPPAEEARKLPREARPSLTEINWELSSKLQHAMSDALRAKAATDPLFGLQVLLAGLHVMAVHGAYSNGLPLQLSVGHGARVSGQPERGKSFGAALNWAKQQDVSTLTEAIGSLAGQLVSIRTYGEDAAVAAVVKLLRPDTAAHFDAPAYCKALTAPQLGLVWKELDAGKLPEKDLPKRVAEVVAEKGWLPPQLRTPDYKGPAGKPKKAKSKKGAPAADNDDAEDDVPAVAAE